MVNHLSDWIVSSDLTFPFRPFLKPPPRRRASFWRPALCLVFWLGFRSWGAAAEEPRLLNIKDLAPGVVIDMRYATENNFTREILYPAAECLLCEPAAHSLARVQKKLEKKGLGLKVWDCYRPLSVQKKLWSIVPDPRYVADPKTGSRHNRGASVDLTLVDRQGRELAMPTEFDEFSPRAHRDFMDLPKEAVENRSLLQRAMEEEGFLGLPTEWWHFDYKEWNRYALRDEPLGSASLRNDIPDQEPAAAKKPVAAVLEGCGQLVVVTSPRWSSGTGELKRFIKLNGKWTQLGQPWPVNLGLKGLAWGRGLHEPMTDGPQKVERDNTAPAGVFKIGDGYGYAPQKPKESKWNYQPVDKDWLCVDDSRSAYYNQIVYTPRREDRAWTSAERMKREDDLYKWVINIEQNFPNTQPGCGSCIFFHVWRREGFGTEGCTAMSEPRMVELFQWLDPELNPHLVQLPQEAYAKLREKWGLP